MCGRCDGERGGDKVPPDDAVDRVSEMLRSSRSGSMSRAKRRLPWFSRLVSVSRSISAPAALLVRWPSGTEGASVPEVDEPKEYLRLRLRGVTGLDLVLSCVCSRLRRVSTPSTFPLLLSATTCDAPTRRKKACRRHVGVVSRHTRGPVSTKGRRFM